MIRIKNYQFSPALIPTIAVLLIVPLFISLGIWQLNRAEQKRVIDRNVMEAQNKQTLNLDELSAVSLNKEIYRTASVLGHYDSQHQYLFDNRTYKGQPGYHVLTPFILSGQMADTSSKALLVNRGWIPFQNRRDQIQDIGVIPDELVLKGVIKQPPRSIVLSEDTLVNSAAFPRTIQSIALEDMSEALNYNFYPVVVELNADEKYGFTRDWQPYYGSVDKHIAYAIQWFAMAIILLLIYIKVNSRRLIHEPNQNTV